MGGNTPPSSSRYAASASPLIVSGPGATGVTARKRQPAQARRHATRQPVPKSQNAGGTLSIGQGFKYFSSFAGGQSTILQGSVGSLQRRQGSAAHDTKIYYARLFAAHLSIAQTQAHEAAVEKWIVALESQVFQLTSTLNDVRTKARQGYDRLKIRVDLLLMRGARSTRSPPRSSSPRTGGGHLSADSVLSTPSPPRYRFSSHGHRRDRSH